MKTEPAPKTILETERLILRQLSPDDAELILELLNEPSFLYYIGDRGVRTIEDARQYILNGPVASYERFGFGPYRVALREGDVPIGMCGLFKRDSLEDPDVGFAFLARFWAKGYAFESASAVMTYGREVLGLDRIVAVTAPDNEASIRVLGKLGLRFAGMVRLTGEDPESRLFTPDA
ncbi:MAG TPA: GNAT family N-acetyltransferase [Thermoanaerobaculia bacterium]|nr:GNAT family N-acetyltransferase [Thermoanaerobaculia bacterium]